MFLPAGEHTLEWEPPSTLPARTYILQLSATPRRAAHRKVTARAVARVLGVDAAFAARTALAGEAVPLYVRTDASHLTVQMMRSGLEQVPTYSNNDLNGIAVGSPFESTGARIATIRARSPYSSRPTGAPASTSPAFRPTMGASGLRRS